MRLIWLAAAGLLIQAAPVAASNSDIDDLPCSKVGQSEIARQSWSINGKPFGAPYRDWDALKFNHLRRRVLDCAAQAGQSPQSQLAYLHRLEGLTQLQNAMAASNVEFRSVVQAAQQSQVMAERSPSQERAKILQPPQRNSEATGTSAPASNETEASLLSKVEAYSTEDDLRTFCRSVWGSNRDFSIRLSVRSNCERRLQLMKVADQENNERREIEESAKQLPGLIQEIKDLPASEETRQRLRALTSNNNYRLSNLSFRDQNTYLQAIEHRLGELESTRVNASCDALISTRKVPDEIRGAIVQDGLGGLPLTTFLCGPILTANNVSVVLAPGSIAEIKVDDYTLTFARRRLLKGQNIDVALESPIKGGVSALVLSGAMKGRERIAIGNPNFFVVNFYSQYTAQLAAYLAQSGR
ncbi:hypothetical protein [Tardiphaga sp. 862_B3_N1_1]|uniref:hypothetical protein n=1 Tax=Tardiphaga sp. 862_B3_N1_1 TaxID=3240763 RepID=UPI003F8C7D53